MKALIFASGLGTRLRPLTDDKPKTLVQVGGREILGRMLDALVQNNIEDVVITTGHLGEKIKEFVTARYPQVHATYVNNPDFATTNYIYSLWLARDALAGSDILSLHADMIFDRTLVGRLLACGGSAVLVQEGEHPSPKDFNARVESGLVKEVRTKITGRGVSFCAPVYKLTGKDCGQWMGAIGQFINEGKTKNYAEDAFNTMSPQFPLFPVFFTSEELCMEIDDFEDLEKAETLLDTGRA